MESHPATMLFPMMGEQELAELARDIQEHGQQVPIVTHQGMILDGRNRYRACEMVGVQPRTQEWQGAGSPTEWVISLNLHRRHLTQSQKAAVAVEALPALEAERKANQGRRTDLTFCVNTQKVQEMVDAAYGLQDACKLDPGDKYVYFVQAVDGGPIKVGKTVDVGERLHALQIGSDKLLRVTKVLPGGHKRETQIHQQFAKYQLHSEWFKPVNTLAELANAIPEGGNTSRREAARLFGVEQHAVQEAKKLSQEAPELFQAVREGQKTITEAKRELKEQKREAVREQNRCLVTETALPTVVVKNERFETIVIDPPWDWGDEGDCDQYGRARPDYATMSIEEIAAVPVGDLVAPNAHLYLWITNRSLPKGFSLLEHWGFRYVTMLTWVKPSFGMGNYFRGSTEQVLFGVKGSLPLLRHDVGTHFSADRPKRHSEKPDAFYQIVETCSPGPWLEMFSRKARSGWVVWGAEVGLAHAV